MVKHVLVLAPARLTTTAAEGQLSEETCRQRLCPDIIYINFVWLGLLDEPANHTHVVRELGSASGVIGIRRRECALRDTRVGPERNANHFGLLFKLAGNPANPGKF